MATDAVLVTNQPDDAHAVESFVTDNQPGEVMLGVYKSVPGDVVEQCETHRKQINCNQGKVDELNQDSATHLREVHSLLAPYGKFKQWCLAAELNYRWAQQRLHGDVWEKNRRHQEKQVNGTGSSTGGLPSKMAPDNREGLPAPTNTVDADDADAAGDSGSTLASTEPWKASVSNLLSWIAEHSFDEVQEAVQDMLNYRDSRAFLTKFRNYISDCLAAPAPPQSQQSQQSH